MCTRIPLVDWEVIPPIKNDKFLPGIVEIQDRVIVPISLNNGIPSSPIRAAAKATQSCPKHSCTSFPCESFPRKTWLLQKFSAPSRVSAKTLQETTLNLRSRGFPIEVQHVNSRTKTANKTYDDPKLGRVRRTLQLQYSKTRARTPHALNPK